MSGDATDPPPLDPRRASSFGARAEFYDRVRPSYPPLVLPLLFAAVMPAQQRETVLAAVRRLTTEHPDLRGHDRVTVSMHLACWPYRRDGSSQVMTRIGWPETR